MAVLSDGQGTNATATTTTTTASAVRTTVNAASTARQPQLLQAAQTALTMVVEMLRNSLVCSAVAWFVDICCSKGQLFSGRPPQSQSYAEFVSAAALWCQLFSDIVTLLLVSLAELLDALLLHSPHGDLRNTIGIFVQAMSYIHARSDHMLDLGLFTCSSILLKICMQEASK